MADANPPEDELAKKAAEAQKEIAAKNQHPAEAEHKEEKKPASTLESVVNETSKLFGNAAKIGAGLAIPAAQAYFLPRYARDTAILTTAQIAADATVAQKQKRKYTAGNFLESAAFGTATTVPLETMFGAVNSIPLTSPLSYFTKAAVWGGICYPAYLAFYQPTAYLIRNRTFKGLGSYIKQNYWKTLKYAWTRFLPISLLNVFFSPTWLQIPVAAALTYLFDTIGAPHKEDVPEHLKKDKTPYYVAAPSVAYKLARNSVKGLYDAVYAIGSSISDLYKSAPKKSATGPAPALAPAH